jgi:hypothetical protein
MGSRNSEEHTRGKLGMPAFLGSLFASGVVVIGGAIFIGTQDHGPINVTAAIQDSSQVLDADGNVVEKPATVPEAFKNIPNGGLVAQDNQPAPEPVAPQAAEPAIEGAATSTETTGESNETEAQSAEELE